MSAAQGRLLSSGGLARAGERELPSSPRITWQDSAKQKVRRDVSHQATAKAASSGFLLWPFNTAVKANLEGTTW